jgi:predicted O-methyltransferase YrrM
VIGSVEVLARDFESIGYDIENTWFGSVDAEILYAMVIKFHPGRIIEVGSGNSTAISLAAMRSNLRDGWGGTLVAIDPDPRAVLDPVVDHRRMKLEDAPRELFDWLVEGDILFIDSSHKWAPGNDVDLLYHQILPALRPGVVVHVHDIFLPDAYPDAWSDRQYDEQEHLRALLDAGQWEVLWSSHQMQLSSPELLAKTFASYSPSRWPGSFWMRKQ